MNDFARHLSSIQAFRSWLEPPSKPSLLDSLPCRVPLLPHQRCYILCRAAPSRDGPPHTSKPRTNPIFVRQPRPAEGRNPRLARKPKPVNENPADIFEPYLSSVPAIGWLTPVSMPRRRKRSSVPERWPNEEEMEQNGWNTDHDFPDPPRRRPQSSPMLHGRGINTPRIRVRASPSAQEGSYKSAAPVRFQGTGDIVEDVIKALRRRPPAPEAVREVMDVYGAHMSKYDVVATVTALQKRHDWRRCFHVSYLIVASSQNSLRK